MERYAWLGKTRKAAMAEVISSSFDAWLQDWCVQHEMCEAAIAEIPIVSCHPEEHAIWMVGLAGGHLLTALSRDRLDTFGGRLALAEAAQSDGVATELACAAMKDLLGRIAAKARQTQASPLTGGDAWPASIVHPEWGGLTLQISFDGFALLVGMDRAAVDAICPQRVGNLGVPLSDRAEALGPLPVTLSAVLDFGIVNARDLAGLRAGEVLVGERAVGQPIALRAGVRHVFDANLARIDGQFAIVAAVPPTGDNP